jgi:hypothetical protein
VPISCCCFDPRPCHACFAATQSSVYKPHINDAGASQATAPGWHAAQCKLKASSASCAVLAVVGCAAPSKHAVHALKTRPRRAERGPWPNSIGALSRCPAQHVTAAVWGAAPDQGGDSTWGPSIDTEPAKPLAGPVMQSGAKGANSQQKIVACSQGVSPHEIRAGVRHGMARSAPSAAVLSMHACTSRWRRMHAVCTDDCLEEVLLVTWPLVTSMTHLADPYLHNNEQVVGGGRFTSSTAG